MALTPETDEEWFAVQGLLGRLRKGESASPDGYLPRWWSVEKYANGFAVKHGDGSGVFLYHEGTKRQSVAADLFARMIEQMVGK